MAGTFQNNRIRIKVDNILNRFGPLLDVLTGARPKFNQAEDVNVELGMYSNAVILADKTNITSVTMEVKSPENLLGAPLITSTVLAAAMDATISDNDWNTNDPLKRNALFSLTKLNTNIALNGQALKELAVFFWIDTNDATSKRIPLGQSPLFIADSGYGDVGSIIIAAPGARMKNNKLQILNQDDGLYYDFVARKNANTGNIATHSLEGAGEA